jgi:DNA polymerase-4
MDDYNASAEKVLNRLAHLCESTGLKMRYKGFCARGISIYIQYKTGDAWHSRRAFKSSFYTTPEIFRRTLLLFNEHPRLDRITMLSVNCYLLEPSKTNQMSILDEVNKEIVLTEAVDELNQRYGNYTVTFANSLGANQQIKQKIPFGTTRYFELLCNQA